MNVILDQCHLLCLLLSSYQQRPLPPLLSALFSLHDEAVTIGSQPMAFSKYFFNSYLIPNRCIYF